MGFEYDDPDTQEEPLKPPKRPWKTGVHEGYKCFRLRVIVAETGNNVFSDVEPASAKDERILLSMVSGGMRQAAYALFTEAMRKETIYTLLLKYQNDMGYRDRMLASVEDPNERIRLEKEIAMTVATTLQGEIQKNAIAVAREAIEGILTGSGAAGK